MGEFCSVAQEGRLTIVTIERPEVMNALHPPGNLELGEIFDEFVADPEQWVAIITGSGGRAFSAGNDLKYQALALMKIPVGDDGQTAGPTFEYWPPKKSKT